MIRPAFQGRRCLLLGLVLLLSRGALADRTVAGRIAAIDTAGPTVTIAVGSTETLVNVMSFTRVTSNGADSDVTHLRVGDRVMAAVSEDGDGLEAVSLRAESAVRRRLIRGTATSVSTATSSIVVAVRNGGRTDLARIVYDSYTDAERDGDEVDPSGVLTGDSIAALVAVQPGDRLTALRIMATPPRTRATTVVTGMIRSIEGDRIVVKPWNSKVKEVLFPPRARGLHRDSRPIALPDLEIGDQIIAFGERRGPHELDIVSVSITGSTARVRGRVMGVDLEGSRLSVQVPALGRAIEFDVYPATVLELNGVEADLNDVSVGDQVIIHGLIRASALWSATAIEGIRSNRSG